MTPASVNASATRVYAPSAYLNDTLVAIEGADKIRDYFARSAERTRALKVQFLEVARTGIDYYVRWEMTIDAPGLGGGQPVVSYGVSQLRFDPQGRILIHKDFWDSATGLWEYAPIVGPVLRRARAAVH
jgi:hypothetical protein